MKERRRWRFLRHTFFSRDLFLVVPGAAIEIWPLDHECAKGEPREDRTCSVMLVGEIRESQSRTKTCHAALEQDMWGKPPESLVTTLALSQ